MWGDENTSAPPWGDANVRSSTGGKRKRIHPYGGNANVPELLWGKRKRARCGGNANARSSTGETKTHPLLYGENANVPEFLWGKRKRARSPYGETKTRPILYGGNENASVPIGVGDTDTHPLLYGGNANVPEFLWGKRKRARSPYGETKTRPILYGGNETFAIASCGSDGGARSRSSPHQENHRRAVERGEYARGGGSRKRPRCRNDPPSCDGTHLVAGETRRGCACLAAAC